MKDIKVKFYPIAWERFHRFVKKWGMSNELHWYEDCIQKSGRQVYDANWKPPTNNGGWIVFFYSDIMMDGGRWAAIPKSFWSMSKPR